MLTALVAEDDMLVRELIVEDLTDAGFAVIAVDSADAALAMIHQGIAADLLFTDISMPGTANGWELGRQALAVLPDLKVIYATGYNHSDVDLSSRERLMAKPYRFDDIIEILKSLGLR